MVFDAGGRGENRYEETNRERGRGWGTTTGRPNRARGGTRLGLVTKEGPDGKNSLET